MVYGVLLLIFAGIFCIQNLLVFQNLLGNYPSRFSCCSDKWNTHTHTKPELNCNFKINDNMAAKQLFDQCTYAVNYEPQNDTKMTKWYFLVTRTKMGLDFSAYIFGSLPCICPIKMCYYETRESSAGLYHSLVRGESLKLQFFACGGNQIHGMQWFNTLTLILWASSKVNINLRFLCDTECTSSNHRWVDVCWGNYNMENKLYFMIHIK